jgi:hypothetical protein
MRTAIQALYGTVHTDAVSGAWEAASRCRDGQARQSGLTWI